MFISSEFDIPIHVPLTIHQFYLVSCFSSLLHSLINLVYQSLVYLEFGHNETPDIHRLLSMYCA